MAYQVQNFKNGTTLEDFHLINMEQAILENEAFLNKFKGKRLSVLGDSISTFGTPDKYNATGLWNYPGNWCRYPDETAGLMDVNQTYWKILMNKTGMIYGQNDCIAGSMIANKSTTNTSKSQGPDRCLSSQTRISHLGANGNPDVILVYGGTNDIGSPLVASAIDIEVGTFDPDNPITFATLTDTPPKFPQHLTEAQIADLDNSTFANAVVTMLIRLQYTYPEAIICCLTPNYTTNFASVNGEVYYGSSYDRMIEFTEMLKTICDYFGVLVIDTRKAGIGVTDLDKMPDGVHPSPLGMHLLAEYIYNQLMSHYLFPETTINTTYVNHFVKIEEDVSALNYIAKYHGGARGEGFGVKAGRASHVYQCLKVKGGSTLSLSQPISDVTLTYSINEFTSLPLSNNTLTSGGQDGLTWLSNNTTLQSNTNYIVIAFKRGDGSTDFSENELTLLKQAISIT